MSFALDGFVSYDDVDARRLPANLRDAASRKGLIPDPTVLGVIQ